jgi:hypothetical protein
VSKVSAYFEIVVNTKLKERANEAQRQKRLAEGKDIFPMTQAEKVSVFPHYCVLYTIQFVLLRALRECCGSLRARRLSVFRKCQRGRYGACVPVAMCSAV